MEVTDARKQYIRWEVISLLKQSPSGMDQQQAYLSVISAMAYCALGHTAELTGALEEALDLLKTRNKPT